MTKRHTRSRKGGKIETSDRLSDDMVNKDGRTKRSVKLTEKGEQFARDMSKNPKRKGSNEGSGQTEISSRKQ